MTWKSACEKLEKTKILYKLLVIYVVVGFIPLCLLGGYFSNQTEDIIMTQHENQITAENQRVNNILLHIAYLATNTSDSLLYDRQLLDVLNTRFASPDQVYKAYRDYSGIQNLLGNYTQFSSIKVFFSNPSMLTSGPFVRITEEVAQTDWYQTIKDNPGKLLWVYDDAIDAYGSLHLLRRIAVDNPDEYAIMAINISNNHLRLMVDSTSISSLIGIDGKQVFHSDNHREIGMTVSELLDLREPADNKPFETTYRNRRVLAYTGTLNNPKSESRFTIHTVDNTAFLHIGKVKENSWRIVLIGFFAPFLMIVLFSTRFNRRISILQGQMHRIARGELEVTETVRGYDELGALFDDMQATIKSMRDLNARIYEEKLMRQKLANYQQQIEFRVLASQINPHFLYNTLESIRMQLIVDGNHQAARIVMLLGKYMRHNIEVDSAPVLLRTELEYIQTYMDIQHFRYGDKIRYTLRIEDTVDIADYHILPLLLQPVVENAFIHGLEKTKTGGVISITIMSAPNSLLIRISDNGSGMDEETLRLLQARIDDSSGIAKDHIGLQNVHQRIRLHYGEPYGITIQSRERQYTTVDIRLPACGSRVDGEGEANHVAEVHHRGR